MSNDNLKVTDIVKLPDGSAVFTASFPLPKDHWLYLVDNEIDNSPEPILTHALKEEIVTAARHAIRAATMNGTVQDFDPDALVQNFVFAVCGPYK